MWFAFDLAFFFIRNCFNFFWEIYVTFFSFQYSIACQWTIIVYCRSIYVVVLIQCKRGYFFYFRKLYWPYTNLVFIYHIKCVDIFDGNKIRWYNLYGHCDNICMLNISCYFFPYLNILFPLISLLCSQDCFMYSANYMLQVSALICISKNIIWTVLMYFRKEMEGISFLI